MIANLSTATPAEIDTELAAIYAAAAPLIAKAMQYRDAAENYRQPKYGPPNEITAAKYDQEASEAAAAYRAKMAECEPFDAEYDRRGGWTRAFIVSGGHVHTSMACSTCYPTTRFGWMPEWSGQPESEIVDAAGERACTICYPSAPVESLSRPSRMFAEDEKAAEVARQARAARSAEIAAKREANRLEMTVVDAYGNRERLYTVTDAKRFLTDAFDTSWSHKVPDVQTLAAVAGALAEKLGTSSQEQMAAAEKRGAKRR